MAGLYEKALPPVAGGVLDQAKEFVDACEYVWAEQKMLKRHLGIFD